MGNTMYTIIDAHDSVMHFVAVIKSILSSPILTHNLEAFFTGNHETLTSGVCGISLGNMGGIGS